MSRLVGSCASPVRGRTTSIAAARAAIRPSAGRAESGVGCCIMVPLRGVGAAAKGLPARKWLWMPAPVRSGRRHPPRVTWFWLVSACCTCPGARQTGIAVRAPSVVEPSPPAGQRGAGTGSEQRQSWRRWSKTGRWGAHRPEREACRPWGAAEAFHAGGARRRGARESTGSTARFDLTCVTSRRHAWLPHRTPPLGKRRQRRFAER